MGLLTIDRGLQLDINPDTRSLYLQEGLSGEFQLKYAADERANALDKILIGTQVTLAKKNDGTTLHLFRPEGESRKFEEGDSVVFVSGSSGHKVRLGTAAKAKALVSGGITQYSCGDKPEEQQAEVERVVHFGETNGGNGRVQSNIKLDNCANDLRASDAESCVVGYGFNAASGGSNWDNRFQLWFTGAPGDLDVRIGGVPVEPFEPDDKRCSEKKSGDGTYNKRCFGLTMAHARMSGEEPLTVNDDLIAEWDFFGDLSDRLGRCG